MDNHTRSIGGDAGGIGSQDHRDLFRTQGLSAKGPNVVVVKAHRLDLDVDPLVWRRFRFDFSDL